MNLFFSLLASDVYFLAFSFLRVSWASHQTLILVPLDVILPTNHIFKKLQK